jgi:hypothetical protein
MMMMMMMMVMTMTTTTTDDSYETQNARNTVYKIDIRNLVKKKNCLIKVA